MCVHIYMIHLRMYSTIRYTVDRHIIYNATHILYSTCVRACVQTYVYTCAPTQVRAHLHKYVRTSIVHTYVYVHTDINTVAYMQYTNCNYI